MRTQISVGALLVGILGLLVGHGTPTGQTGSTPTPPGPMATPTIDRLAAPPTVASPTQADAGAQLYWLHCQPCHGDRGQGLTDEWRAQYPPEDQNCWESGCHGKRPYERGFTLPESVPALIGPDSLERFANLAQVYEFVRASMPFQNPGHLTAEEYLAITAYLARAHDVWDGRAVTAASAVTLQLNPPPAESDQNATAQAVSGQPEDTTLPAEAQARGDRITWVIAGVGLVAFILLILAGVGVWRKLRQ